MYLSSDSMSHQIMTISLHKYDHGNWSQTTDNISLESQLVINWEMPMASGQTKLWAWTHDLLPLCLGHILLDKVLPAYVDTELNSILAWQGQVEQKSKDVFRVKFEPKIDLVKSEAKELLASPELLLSAMQEFLNLDQKHNSSWDLTGSIHRMGLYNLENDQFIMATEDIARHNCLDRLLGFLNQQGLDPAHYVLFLTARLSAGLYAKLKLSGFKFLVSKGALTSHALMSGQEDGLTLVGFCKPQEQRLSVFAGEQRIKGAAEIKGSAC